MIHRFTLSTALLLILTLANVASLAEGLYSTDAMLIGERPNASGPPTDVTIGVYVFDIDDIDDANQRFNIDMMMRIVWQDPRLALPERLGRTRTLDLAKIWTPRGLIVNDRGLKIQLPRVAEVDDDGNVSYLQRLTGPMAADLRFEKFPFDTQLLRIVIVSYRYTPEDIKLSFDGEISGDDGSFSAEGWNFKILEPEIGEYAVPGRVADRAMLTYFIEADRNTRYYMLTMILPMSLVLFMSWTVFWLQPDNVNPRIGISTASIFSLIALGFSVRLSLPPFSYLTRADVFTIGCTLMVFMALGAAVIGSRWASGGHMERALRLNAIARWVYVGLFCLVSASAMMI